MQLIVSSVADQPNWGGRKKYDVLQVKTIGLKDTLLAICSERADSWSDIVKHAFCMYMTYMQQMQSIIRLVVSIFVQESKSQWLISRQALKTLRDQSLAGLKLMRGQ